MASLCRNAVAAAFSLREGAILNEHDGNGGCEQHLDEVWRSWYGVELEFTAAELIVSLLNDHETNLGGD